MTDTNKNFTLNAALAATTNEERAALTATVAWAAVVLDKVLGWNGPQVKGGKAIVIKGLREVHGYRKDADGFPVLDSKGNRAKRTSVFRHLARADSLIGYMVKSAQDWVELLHRAAMTGDADTFAAALDDVTQFMADRMGGTTGDAVDHFLKHGTRKADAKPDPVAEGGAVAALAGSEPEAPAKGDTVASPSMADKVMKLLTGPRNRLGEFTDAQLRDMAQALSGELAKRTRDTEELAAGERESEAKRDAAAEREELRKAG